MFKIHEPDECGAPDKVDGWIVKLFPYNKMGNRNISYIENNNDGSSSLPDEIVKLNIEYVRIETDGTKTNIPLEIYSGFVGIEQDKQSLTLRPKIGWFILKKDIDKSVLKKSMKKGVFMLRVNQFPKELYGIELIDYLELEFTNRIHIPKEVQKIHFKLLSLNGRMTWWKQFGVLKILNADELFINNSKYELRIRNIFFRFVLGKFYELRTWFIITKERLSWKLFRI